MTTTPKPSARITALRSVELIPQGINDDNAEARRRIVMQLLERGVTDTEDLLTIAQYVELGTDDVEAT